MLKLAAITLLSALGCGAACADPGYYVVTPYDNAGVRTLDLRYWSVQRHGGNEVVWPEIGLAYGVNTRWTTELLLSYIGPSDLSVHPSTLNWQNDVLLTQGEWPVDVAVHAQWIHAMSAGHGNSLEWGPVLQTDVGRTQLNANLFLEQGMGSHAGDPTRLKYQWQVRHRWTPTWHFGAQGFGELGPWDNWAPWVRQSHRAGPAVFGTWHLGAGQTIKLHAAYLLGKTYGHAGHMFTFRSALDF